MVCNYNSLCFICSNWFLAAPWCLQCRPIDLGDPLRRDAWIYHGRDILIRLNHGPLRSLHDAFAVWNQ